MNASRTPSGGLDPHRDEPMLTAGVPIDRAKLALILIHGRGGSAEDLLHVYRAINLDGISAFAPQAANCTWYPNSFMAPIATNQPFLDSALRRIETLIGELLDGKKNPRQIAILGFSQGACVALQSVAQNPRRYAAVMGLSGGLIGPAETPRDYPGSLSGTPIFLGAVDPDPHVPFARVQEAETVLRAMGGEVELRRYPGMPHTINNDELAVCQTLLEQAMKK